MKTVFLLLVLANVAFFAYGWTTRERLPQGSVAALEVSPEKIRLLKPGEKPPPSSRAPSEAPAAVAAAAPAVCIEWGAVAGAEVARAEAAIASLSLPESRVQRTPTNAGGYWVYLPPVESKAQLDRSVGQLTALGITDFYVVQEATPWRNAVSLGIFKSEEAAKSFLQTIHTRGVTAAVAGRRENLLKQFAYFVQEPDEVTVASLARLQSDFPGTRIKAVPCPQPAR
jgi:hypothetical protein